jgi:murein L,D-transpeptidase YafK
MGVWEKLFLAAEMQRDQVEEVAKNFWRQWEESYDCVEEKEKEEGESWRLRAMVVVWCIFLCYLGT